MDFEHLKDLVSQESKSIIYCSECGESLEVDIPRETSTQEFQIACPHCQSSVTLKPPPSPFPQVGTQLDHYLILEEIAHGGSSIVFKAKDQRDQKFVAIKILKASEEEPQRITRLFREAQALEKLDLPALTKIYQFGHSGPYAYLVMEFVDGPTLRKASLNLKQFVEALVEVSEALEKVHELGIVHRDVKPENILIHPDGLVKIVDFGIARIPGHTLTITREGQLAGTPRYMAPEHLKGEMASPHLDQYALGVILFERLAGRAPFEGESIEQVVSSILSGNALRPADYNENADSKLEAIALKAMAVQSKDRFSSLKEFHAELRRWLNNQPTLTRIPSPWKRYVKNNSWSVGLTAASIILVAIAFFAVTWSIEANRIKEIRSRVLAKTTSLLEGYEKALLTPPESFKEEREKLAEEITELEKLKNQIPKLKEISFCINLLRFRLTEPPENWEQLYRGEEWKDSPIANQLYLHRAMTVAEYWLRPPLHHDLQKVISWRKNHERASKWIREDLNNIRQQKVVISSGQQQFFDAFLQLSAPDFGKTEELCKKSLASTELNQSQRADVYQILGIYHLIRKVHSKANKAFSEAANIKRSDAHCLLGLTLSYLDPQPRDLQQVLKILDTVKSLEAPHPSTAYLTGYFWMLEGARLLDQNDKSGWRYYDKAITEFQRATKCSTPIAAFKKLASLHTTRAYYHLQHQENEAAEKEAKLAIEYTNRVFKADHSSRETIIASIRAQHFLKVTSGSSFTEGVPSSLDKLNQSIQSSPQAIDLLLERASLNIHQAKKDHSEQALSYIEVAKKDLLKVIELNQESYRGHETLGNLYLFQSKWSPRPVEQIQKAESHFTQALMTGGSQRLSIQISRAIARHTLASETKNISLLRSALNDLEEVVSKASKHSLARLELGKVLWKLGDTAAANDQFQQAQTLNPQLEKEIEAFQSTSQDRSSPR